ncbi:hypothetical protein ACFL40_05870 [candidate division KSB1 bacterium]
MLLFTLIIFVISLYCSKNPVSGNNSPVITSIIASKSSVNLNEVISVRALYFDTDGDSLVTKWSSTGGAFSKIERDSVVWIAPDTMGSSTIILEIDDLQGGRDIDSVVINVANRPPIVSEVTLYPTNVFLDNKAVLRAVALDPDGQAMIYTWSATRDDNAIGSFISTEADSAVWIAPSTPGNVKIMVVVRDIKGGEATFIKNIKVYSAIGSVWTSDTQNHRVVMLSSTGDVLYSLDGFSYPEGIDLNWNDRTVLVADYGNNRIVKISKDGNIEKSIPGFIYPHSVSIWSFDGSAWISQNSDSNQVVKLSPDGMVTKRINGFNNPKSISVNQKNGDIWIADTGNNRIVKLLSSISDNYDINNPPSTQTKHTIFTLWNNKEFSEPTGLSVNSTTGDCWFADKRNNRVIRILVNGSKINGVIGFLKPENVSVNDKNEDVWVADTGNNRVIQIKRGIFASEVIYDVSSNGHLGFHEIVSGNFRQPYSVSVNSNEGEVWFTAESSVVKIYDSGGELETMKIIGFNTSRGIVVNPGFK